MRQITTGNLQKITAKVTPHVKDMFEAERQELQANTAGHVSQGDLMERMIIDFCQRANKARGSQKRTRAA